MYFHQPSYQIAVINPDVSGLNHPFPMIFLWFSHGFPAVAAPVKEFPAVVLLDAEASVGNSERRGYEVAAVLWTPVGLGFAIGGKPIWQWVKTVVP